MSSSTPRPRAAGAWATVREFFWLIDLAVLVMFAFFLALGAFGLGDSTVLTVLIAALGVLYVAHIIFSRRGADRQTAVAMRDRERRGF